MGSLSAQKLLAQMQAGLDNPYGSYSDYDAWAKGTGFKGNDLAAGAGGTGASIAKALSYGVPIQWTALQETGRVPFGKASYTNPNDPNDRFLSAKDIDYGSPGSVSEFYGVNASNIFDRLDPFIKDYNAGNLRTTGSYSGGNQEIYDYFSKYGSPAVQQYLRTGERGNVSGAELISLYDNSLRDIGYAQQNKTNVFDQVSGYVGTAVGLATGNPYLAAGVGGVYGGLGGGPEGAVSGAAGGFAAGGGLSEGLSTVYDYGSNANRVAKIFQRVSPNAPLYPTQQTRAPFGSNNILSSAPPTSAYAAAYPGASSVANSAARPINTAPIAPINRTMNPAKPYVAPRVQIAPNMPIIKYDPRRNYPQTTTMQQALMRPAATRAPAQNVTAIK